MFGRSPFSIHSGQESDALKDFLLFLLEAKSEVKQTEMHLSSFLPAINVLSLLSGSTLSVLTVLRNKPKEK